MKKQLFSSPWLVACLLTATLLTGCKKKPDDAALTTSVQDKIATVAPGVTVTVKEGVATLSGEVAAQGDITQAETLAKGVEGISSVTNSLTVKPEPMPQPAAVTVSPDDELRTKVTENFGKYGISGVTATVANGEVTLTGDVKRAKLQEVMKAANEASPKKVINQLKIN